MALLLAGMGLPGSASATPVSVSAIFTQLRMGSFSASDLAASGLSVNNLNINVCAADPTCQSILPVPLSGNSVTFGYDTIKSPTARMNVLSFAGNPNADVAGPGIQFDLGTFTFTNGQFYPLVYLDFTLTTQSVDSALNDKIFSGSIALNSISGHTFPFTDASDEAEADYFTVQNVAGDILANLGSFRVYDYNRCPSYSRLPPPACNTGSAHLNGHINSLELDSFSNPTGGAFLNSSTTAELAPTAAPEPSTLAILALGLAVLGFSRRKRAS